MHVLMEISIEIRLIKFCKCNLETKRKAIKHNTALGLGAIEF